MKELANINHQPVYQYVPQILQLKGSHSDHMATHKTITLTQLGRVSVRSFQEVDTCGDVTFLEPISLCKHFWRRSFLPNQ